MKNYIVIESNDQNDFSYRVSGALNEGYECVGGVFFQQLASEPGDPTRAPCKWLHFAQGMVKTI